ncbi:hypothetical protein QVD17_30245 [Tagetes erecta]|uniref:Uncharacterized protein n=1 Tax=Tagetes erecta TaxID=13708 RepID=A0AAD8NM32_TARER|nr:hypothetical protein QVD17_30245 [Tagetes erecta]
MFPRLSMVAIMSIVQDVTPIWALDERDSSNDVTVVCVLAINHRLRGFEDVSDEFRIKVKKYQRGEGVDFAHSNLIIFEDK